MKRKHVFAMLLSAVVLTACTSIVALRNDGVVPLDGGWTADGRPVSLPHCWNVGDGTDGPAETNCWNHNSVGGTGYARKRVVYARELPPAASGKKRYLRVNAASIHAVVRLGRVRLGHVRLQQRQPPRGESRRLERQGPCRLRP